MPLDEQQMAFRKVVLFMFSIFGAKLRRKRSKESSTSVYHVSSEATDRKAQKNLNDLQREINGAESEAEGKTGLKNGGANCEDEAICCICLSEFREGDGAADQARVLPCLHEFHRACVETWLNVFCKTCPICRYPMEFEGKEMDRQDLTEEMITWFSSFHISGF